MDSLQEFNFKQWLRSTPGLVFLAFLAIAAFYLIIEHTAHVFRLLPFALLLLCPLMMLFMHGGHGDHAGHSPQNQRDSGSENPPGHVH